MRWLGILMLDTTSPRIAGDVGHTASWRMPVHYQTVVLECTNLPPYADAVQRATGRPVHHLMTFVHERWEAMP
jgi:hypothetical protein